LFCHNVESITLKNLTVTTLLPFGWSLVNHKMNYGVRCSFTTSFRSKINTETVTGSSAY